MAKCISYSLFGFGKARQENCFDFNSYARSLMISIRMNRLVYPEFTNVLNTDKETYEAFKDLLDGIWDLEVYVNEPEPLCKAMLWRLKPIYLMKGEKDWDKPRFTHVLCRDLDSPCTTKEAKCVQYWMNKGSAMHAITDSVSHNIPLMGGMIGIKTDMWTLRMPKTWNALLELGRGIDYNIKGTDQTFLNQVVYPAWASKGSESITQHYLLGMANTFLNDFQNTVPEYIELGLPAELDESRDTCGHIGASGAYMTATERFLRKHADKYEDLFKLESLYPDIFYWVKDKSLGWYE
jgi:hypothetical protein